MVQWSLANILALKTASKNASFDLNVFNSQVFYL